MTDDVPMSLLTEDYDEEDTQFTMPYPVAKLLSEVEDIGLLELEDIYALGSKYHTDWDGLISYVLKYAVGIEEQCVKNTNTIRDMITEVREYLHAEDIPEKSKLH